MMKTHWRMYKDGKRWVFAAATMTALTLGLGTLNVRADEQQGQISTVAVQENQSGDSQGEPSSADQDAGAANEQPVEQTKTTDQTAATVTSEQSSAAQEQATSQNQTPDQRPAETQPSAGQQVVADEPASTQSTQSASGHVQQPASQAAQQAPTQPERATTAQQPQAKDVEEATATNSNQASQSSNQATEPAPAKSQPEDQSVIGQSVDQTPVAKSATALKKTNSSMAAVDINSWMPDKNIQSQILALLISENILASNATVNDITQENVAQIVGLQLGAHKTATYHNPYTGQSAESPDVYTADETHSVADLTGIGYFTGLKDLILTDNSFTTIPDEISQLTNLESLEITRNTKLTSIGDLSGLTKLTTLKITNNPFLSALPSSINQLTNLKGTLALNGNSFTTLPDMSALQGITTLDLNNNRLTDVSQAGIEKLVNLTTLNVGSYDGLNYAEWINGFGADLNTGNNPEQYDPYDLVPQGENNVHLNYDPTAKVNNFTLIDNTGNGFYAYADVFNWKDIEHYNHLTAVPDAWSQLVNLTHLNLIGNDLVDLPASYAALTKLTDLRLGNNKFKIIPAAIGDLVKNPNFSVNFNNYLSNYPSYGTYRNQNSIPQNEIWDSVNKAYVLPGWNPAKDQVLSQVIKFPDHYVVTYNSNKFNITGGQLVNPLDDQKINDSQFITLNDYYYTGPGHLSNGQTDPDGIIVQQFVHYPTNWPDGTDHTGKYTAPSKNSWNYGNGYWGGMYGATNDVLTVRYITTRGPDGKPMNEYPYLDPYGVVQNDSYLDQATVARMNDGRGNYYYVILLPREWSPDGSNLGKTYSLNFSVGGRYNQNAPDGGSSNGTGSMGGFVNPDQTGYSMVASTDVTFVNDGIISISAKNSEVFQGHVWDPSSGFDGATINDANQTKITSYYGQNGQPVPGLGVTIQEVTLVYDNNGEVVAARPIRTFRDADDFNNNATTWTYTDATNTEFARDTNGNKIPRYFAATYHYGDASSNLAFIYVDDNSSMTIKDATVTANGTWTISGSGDNSSQLTAKDADGVTVVSDSDPLTNKDQIQVAITDDADPTKVFTSEADFNANKVAGHTYTVSVIEYDKRSEEGLTGLQFVLQKAQAKITVTDAVKAGQIKVAYVDEQGNNIAPSGTPNEATYPDGQYDGKTFEADQLTIPGYTFKVVNGSDGLSFTVSGDKVVGILKNEVTGTITFVYYQNSAGVKVNYVDEQHNPIAPAGNATYPDGQYTGHQYETNPMTIAGYTFDQISTAGLAANGTLTQAGGTVIYVYKKTVTPPTPPTPPTPDTPVTPSMPVSPTGLDNQTVVVEPAATIKKKIVKLVYAKQAIRVHKNATFKKGEGTFYQKKPRIYAPVFKVTGVAYSKNGLLRYKVKGGYITANPDFVAPVYYSGKQRKVTVISPKGIYLHKGPGFKQSDRKKATFLKQGTMVKNIVRVVRHGQFATRFYLANGSYITGNKLFVSTKAPYMPYKVYNIKAINQYKTVNLNGKLGHYANKPRTQRSVFKVNKWDYSRGDVRTMHGVKRYKVKGGYITANPKYVRSLYYLTKSKTVKVINNKGIYYHVNKKFANRQKTMYVKKGTQIKIKAIKQYGKITRFYTPSGHWITSNKKFVIGKY